MKKALYSLADEEFATLLARTHSALKEAEIPYMFVGGVATQAHVSNYLCKKHGKTVMDFVDSPTFRIQDHLRATDDVDITLDVRRLDGNVASANKIIYVLDKIVAEQGTYVSPTGNHLVSLVLERKGVRRPVFKLALDKDATDPDKVASFNFYLGPDDTNDRWGSDIRDFEKENYFDFMNRGVELEIPYFESRTIALRVKKVEDLLATKIIRAREKDWNDILALARHSADAGMPINYEELRRVICKDMTGCNKPHISFVEKFDEFMRLKDLEPSESSSSSSSLED